MEYPNISAELAEETGWHIGDGSMNYYKNHFRLNGLYSLRGHIEDDREHYNEKIRQVYKELYDLDISLRDMPSTGCYGFQKWSNELVDFKSNFISLPLGKKIDINIPELFRRKFSLDLVRGVFDTDGNLYLERKNNKLYPRISISSTSRMLISQINSILHRSGFRSTIYSCKPTPHNWKELYIVNVRGEKMLFKWFKLISPANPKNISKYQHYLDNS